MSQFELQLIEALSGVSRSISFLTAVVAIFSLIHAMKGVNRDR